MIDSHAHLTSSVLFENLPPLLERAKIAGVEKIVNICTDADSLSKGIELSKEYPWIYNAAATTPHDVEKQGDRDFDEIKSKVKFLKAIGETGLDYHYEYSPRDIQKKFLIKYLELAIEASLPIVIHCREAFQDFFDILDDVYLKAPNKGGVLHCFTGTVAESEKVLERGFYLSFSGIVTFKKSLEIQESAKKCPLEKMLIETDSPYLAPQKKRGHQNEPAFVKETAEFIASLKGLEFSQVSSQTKTNAEKLFLL